MNTPRRHYGGSVLAKSEFQSWSVHHVRANSCLYKSPFKIDKTSNINHFDASTIKLKKQVVVTYEIFQPSMYVNVADRTITNQAYRVLDTPEIANATRGEQQTKNITIHED